MSDQASGFGWTTFAGVGAAIIVIGLTIYALSGFGKPAARLAQLPPVQTVDVQPGFEGKQPFGLWTLMCQSVQAKASTAAGQPTRLCRTNARMMVQGPNNATLLAAGFNVLMLDTKRNPAIVFRLPPAASAANSIGFAIDRNTMFTASLKCSPQECIAQGALPSEALAQMRQGQLLKVIYTIRDKSQKERKVRVDQLLHGFRQSYDAMTSALAS